MSGDTRKTVKIRKETYEQLIEISPSPSKAIDLLLENNSTKKISNADAYSSILKELNELQDIIEKIVQLNGLRTY